MAGHDKNVERNPLAVETVEVKLILTHLGVFLDRHSENNMARYIVVHMSTLSPITNLELHSIVGWNYFPKFQA